MKRRITILALTLCLCLSISVQTFAGPNPEANYYTGVGRVTLATNETFDIAGYVYYHSNTATSLNLHSTAAYVYYTGYPLTDAFLQIENSTTSVIDSYTKPIGLTSGSVRVEKPWEVDIPKNGGHAYCGISAGILNGDFQRLGGWHVFFQPNTIYKDLNS